MSLLSRLAVQAARAYGILSSNPNNVSADYLVVAGGGGGGAVSGASAGGGGAGGLLTSTATLSTLNTYSVTVGAGGAGGVSGSNSVLSGTGLTTITSTGGGRGGSVSYAASTGGSGGGGGYFYYPTGAAGTSGQGFAGGNGNNVAGNRTSGGGGGSGSVGVNFTSTASGNGGNGTASSISGSSVTYAGGGGGGAESETRGTGQAGGGNGGNASNNCTSATANTGSGGGGMGGNQPSSTTFGAGGSGIVIISYTSAEPKFVGGTITTSGGKQIHTFTSSGTLSPITPITASYLVVAGGGGGQGDRGGGGGAGGLLTSSTTLYSGATYVVTVGAGGNGSSGTGATNGSNSVLSGTGLTTLTSIGGGYSGGGVTGGVGASGGSGGGGSAVGSTGQAGGAGTSGQGYAGGTGYSTGSGYFSAAGGGGAGAVGTNGSASSAGAGGVGISSSISGTATYYAGGGGGSADNRAFTAAGTGGTGGGGSGGALNSNGSSGTPNTGGGGGGGSGGVPVYNGGNGGSGIVIISYAGSQAFNGGLVTTSGGNTIHTFTSTGALTPLTNNLNNSLRFRSSASAYLNRTPTIAGNQQKFTWSGWVKIGYFTTGYLQAADGNSGNTMTSWYMRGLGSTGVFEFEHFNGTTTYNLTTNAVFRDPSAWYHITVSVDTTQATSADRTKIYVNGNQQTVTGTYVPQNTTLYVNGTTIQAIGSRKNVSGGYGAYFDGYMTDINFIDGQALEPYYFGNNDANGVWKPIQYKGTYGTNGFYLTFGNTTSTTTLGYDSSPNGNNWTCNNISLTAGTTYDAMLDVPTNTSATVANYCVFSPLWTGSPTLSNGNLQITSATTSQTAIGSMATNSGKFYFEYQYTSSPATNGGGGVWDINSAFSAGGVPDSGTGARYVPTSGNIVKFINGSATTVGTYATYTSGDVIGVGFDCDAGTVSFYKNNTLQVTITDSNFISKFFAPCMYVYTGNVVANFGQRPFSYTPPTGFVALNTYNLPTPTILQGNKYMDATLYTGTGTTQVVVNQAQFKPDMVWMKARSGGVTNHALVDSVRPSGYALYPNLTDAEANNSTLFTGITSNGFTLAGNNATYSGSGYTYVGWQWQAGQGSTSSNTSGSITSTVSVNTTAGFSIVTYTGNNTDNTNYTIGHGLGVKPAMIIVKNRDWAASTGAWVVWHQSQSTSLGYLNGNYAFDSSDFGYFMGNTQPTNSLFTVRSDTVVSTANRYRTNGGGSYKYVAYCFAEIAGFSRFGSYTGNGSTDGPFVFTGFRPKFVLIKYSSGVENWAIWDTSRNTYNVMDTILRPDSTAADTSGSTQNIDFVSNGFKIRGTDGKLNTSSGTYIYAAFAEHPFKNANAR